MAKHQRLWAKKKKEELRIRLGGKCQWPGTCNKTSSLEFDCIQAMGHQHHRMSSADRVSFYLAQLKNNNLQLLCRKHHQIKSVTERPPPKKINPEIDEPF